MNIRFYVSYFRFSWFSCSFSGCSWVVDVEAHAARTLLDGEHIKYYYFVPKYKQLLYINT